MQEEIKKGHTATEKQPEKKKVNLDIRPYLAIGLTAILVVMICIAIFFVIIFQFSKDITESSGHCGWTDRSVSAQSNREMV